MTETITQETNEPGQGELFDDNAEGAVAGGSLMPIQQPVFRQGVGWELQPVEPEQALEILTKRQELIPKVRTLSLKAISPLDVTVRVATNGTMRCLVEAAGCDKIRNLLGIVIMPDGPAVEIRRGEHYEFRFTVNAFSPVTRVAVFQVEGVRSTDEKFFEKKARGNMAEARAHARRSAYQQAQRRAIETLAGIRNLTPETIEQAAGFTIPDTQYIRYAEGKHGGKTTDQKAQEGFVVARQAFWRELLEHYGGDTEAARDWLSDKASFGDKAVNSIEDVTTPKWLGRVKSEFEKERKNAGSK